METSTRVTAPREAAAQCPYINTGSKQSQTKHEEMQVKTVKTVKNEADKVER